MQQLHLHIMQSVMDRHVSFHHFLSWRSISVQRSLVSPSVQACICWLLCRDRSQDLACGGFHSGFTPGDRFLPLGSEPGLSLGNIAKQRGRAACRWEELLNRSLLLEDIEDGVRAEGWNSPCLVSGNSNRISLRFSFFPE